MKLVLGEGPQPCSVLLCGEAPGWWEQQYGRPFHPRGKSGRELRRYLERAHLPAEECYLTNVYKLQPPEKSGKQTAPTPAMIKEHSQLLREELHAVRPRWIMAIGRTALRTLTGQDLSLEWAHGFAFPLSDGWDATWQCQVVGAYHPAAALHNDAVAKYVWFDIKQFGEYVRGDAVPVQPLDQYQRPVYTELALFSARYGTIGLDTEGWEHDPISAQISERAGQGAFYELSAAPHRSWSLNFERVVGHNWLGTDLGVLRAAGYDMESLYRRWDDVHDTMLMSFALGTMPLGLKPLSRRVSGAVQQTYAEVVQEAERRIALEWVQRAIAARACKRCGGTGKVPAFGKQGQRLKRQDKCSACVDGGMWQEREQELDWDWSSGGWKWRGGWQAQRYLRTMQCQIEEGKFNGDSDDDSEDGDGGGAEPVSLRTRIDRWPEAVQEQITEAVGELKAATLRDVPRSVMVNYSVRDADLTLRNFPVLDRMIDEQGLRAAYRLDMDVVPIAHEMERNGMAVDVAGARALSRRLLMDNDITLRKLHTLVKRPINPNSGDQVAALLFGERKLSLSEEDEHELLPHLSFELEAEKMTRSGKRASVDDKVLEGIKLKYADRDDVQEAVGLVLEHRARSKIEQFASKIANMSKRVGKGSDEHWRIYTRIKLTTAATYRFASGDTRAGLLNLQNIPTRNKGGMDLGKQVRALFIAPQGQALLGADYSQIELRILALLSQDEELLRAFRTGIDPHVLGAARAWGRSYEELMSAYKSGDKSAADIRDSSKNLNFGIVFGITPRGLQAQMQLRGIAMSLDECADMIRMWTRTVFPGIGDYIERVQSYGKLNGYTRSVMGHMRHCPGVWSDIPSIREEALRMLVNFTIQSSAAEVLKAGLGALWRKRRMWQRALMLMSVHDENLMQCPVADAEGVGLVMETYMRNPVQVQELSGLDIEAKVKMGQSWAQLKTA
jgi:uracil-DNA glycosylase family 4